jgi:hypothetical protein
MKVSGRTLISHAKECLTNGYSVDLRQYGEAILNDLLNIYNRASAIIAVNGQVTQYELSNH